MLFLEYFVYYTDICGIKTNHHKEIGYPMKDQQLLERIALNHDIMVGKPVIKGTRLTVEYILNLLAHGETIEDILGEYKGLIVDDVQACLLFATKSLENTAFMPLETETT